MMLVEGSDVRGGCELWCDEDEVLARQVVLLTQDRLALCGSVPVLESILLDCRPLAWRGDHRAC